jgi:hypothetical protein
VLSRLFGAAPLVELVVQGKTAASVSESDLPCEKQPVVRFDRGAVVEIRGKGLAPVAHFLGHEEGFAHFSVRVSAALACQIDCAVTSTEKYEQTDLKAGRASGIRFQPLLLAGARDSNATFVGRGLFFRGLHYAGTITPGNVSLACVCDHCLKTFRLQSFHAGFSQVGYFYSGSGAYTLTVSAFVPGSPPALGKPDLALLALLEAKLPLAPDGSRFSYLNSLRCPHCYAAYIDFERFPEQRENEYYGNVFMGKETLRYEPVV